MLLLAINTVLSILQVEKLLDSRDTNEIQHGSRVNAAVAGQCLIPFQQIAFNVCSLRGEAQAKRKLLLLLVLSSNMS